ncbi:MAG: hypothetical protein JXP48_12265 [Acidobacteria bacterium]|nr:hypothetical protein [Acidobacteriota bacterium]
MNHLHKLVISVALLLLLGAAVPAAFAQGAGEANWPMTVTMQESFRIGDLVFPAGGYYIRLTPGTVSRNVVMVYSMDRERWEGMVQGIYTSREDKDVSSGLIFSKRMMGEPLALETWFYPNWKRGLSFANHPGTYLAGNTSGNSPRAVAMASR